MPLALARVASGGRRPGRLPAHLPLARFDGARLSTGRIALGSCVNVCLDSDYGAVAEEGVVIAIVPAGHRVITPRAIGSPRIATVERYVVQCWGCRIVRRAEQMVVIWL